MLIIGIAGGTGSGKTTVVRKIIQSLPHNEVAVISQDSYYRDNSHLPIEERQKINFDHPDSIEFELLVDHIKKLKNGIAIDEPSYDYLTCSRLASTKHIEPKNVVIVEGILILTSPEIRDLADIKVFVSADADDRLIRVIKRDLIERGRTIENTLDRYQKSVKPMHNEFIEPTMKYADIIVPQGGHNEVAINILTSIVRMSLESNSQKH